MATKKLADDKSLRLAASAAICPTCGNRRALVSQASPGQFWCLICNYHWPIEATA